MTIPSRSGCYISAVDAQFALVVSWNVAMGEWFFCACLLANMLWPGDSIPDRWLPTTFSGSQFCHPEKATSRIVTYIQYTIRSMYVIFTYAYFWWGSNQNMTLMWWLLVPMSQDVIPEKPFGWNTKPKQKYHAHCRWKEIQRNPRLVTYYLSHFRTPLHWFFCFSASREWKAFNMFDFKICFKRAETTTTTTSCNQIVSFILLFCQCCQRPPKKNRGKICQSKRDGFFNGQGLNTPKRHGEAAHVVFQWQIFMQAKCVICLPGSWKKYKPWEFFEKKVFEGPHSRVDLKMFFHPSTESLRRDGCSWTSKLVLLIKMSKEVGILVPKTLERPWLTIWVVVFRQF